MEGPQVRNVLCPKLSRGAVKKGVSGGHSERDDAGQRLGKQAVHGTARPPNADACGGVYAEKAIFFSIPLNKQFIKNFVCLLKFIE